MTVQSFRARFDLVAGHEAPCLIALIDIDTGTGDGPLDLSQANTFTGHARLVTGGATTDLPVTVQAPPADGIVAVDASALAAGEYLLQIGFTDTAGRDHRYPSDGDGFRLAVHEAI